MSAANIWWKPQGSPQSSRESSPQDRDTFESTPIDVPQDEADKLPSRRIHIIGMGSIGTFIAHALKNLPNPPPVTLLMHRQRMYELFKKQANIIRLIDKKTNVNDEQTGYDVDVLEQHGRSEFAYWRYHPDRQDGGRTVTNPRTADEILDTGETLIHSLIISVKGPQTVDALRSLKHRLNVQSTICFMQNGMGQIEEVNREVFPDPSTRPTYLLGIISHGIYMTNEFTAFHAGFGTTALGIYRDRDKYPFPPSTSSMASDLSDADRKKFYPTDAELYSPISARHILHTLIRSSILTCAAFGYLDLHLLQLEKLAMNSIINPVTALLDIQNGHVLNNTNLGNVHHLLITEISLVLRNLPELQAVPGVQHRFSRQRLEKLFVGIAAKTAQNSSSMREDMRNLRKPEVEYINGYIVRRGEEQGIKCVLNYMLMQLVLGKSWDLRKGEREIVPRGAREVAGRISVGPQGEPRAEIEELGRM